MNYYLKQPWVQALIAFVVIIGLAFGLYYYGKAQGRKQAGTEFDARQAALLKKSQDALALADASAKKALESEIYAGKLKDIIAGDRKTAADNEARVTAVYNNSIKEINDKYESDKTTIASSLSDCDRCLDLCRRTNQLASYGPEFASYHCDPDSGCRAACDTGHSEGP